jgi:aspartate kinase
MKTIIHKIGGGIIQNGGGIEDIDRIFASYDQPQLHVFSALRGMTDVLKEYSKTRDEVTLCAVLGIYNCAASRWIKGSQYQDSFSKVLRDMHSEAAHSKNADEILSVGERLATELYYHHKKSIGVDIGKVNFDRNSAESFPIVCTDFREDADILLEKSKERIGIVREELERYGECAVPGFVGVTDTGEIRTLGRGGTDDSAIYYAHALGSGEVNLWKETEGLRTADPKIIKNTKLVDYASYSEVNNMSKFGAKIVQHKSSNLARDTGVVIRIPYVKNPDIFTVVDGQEKKDNHLVKYVGGSSDALLMETDFDEMLRIRESCRDQNMKHDFHTVGSNYEFARPVILNSKKSFSGGTPVGVVALVGDKLKETSGVLMRAAVVADRKGINIEDFASGGGRESYMFFLCHPENTNSLISAFHEEFIEKEPSWNQSGL